MASQDKIESLIALARKLTERVMSILLYSPEKLKNDKIMVDAFLEMAHTQSQLVEIKNLFSPYMIGTQYDQLAKFQEGYNKVLQTVLDILLLFIDGQKLQG